jgi:hypothetical protein
LLTQVAIDRSPGRSPTQTPHCKEQLSLSLSMDMALAMLGLDPSTCWPLCRILPEYSVEGEK